MNLAVFDWAMQARTNTIGEKAVLLMLARHSDAAGLCYPSLKRLSEAAGIEKRSVQRQLAALEKLGLIARIPRYRERKDGVRGKQTSNGYQLAAPTAEPVFPIVNPMGDAAVIHDARVIHDTGVAPTPDTRVTPRVTRASPHEVGVEVRTSKKPSSRKSLVVEGEGEEVVNDLWKRLKPVVLGEWHQGDEQVWIEGEPCGMGLEKLHVGQLVAVHGAEATELAIRAAPHVPRWRDGWPRTLAWFTSPQHGGGNFHEALHFARGQRRGSSRNEARLIGELAREVLERARFTA